MRHRALHFVVLAVLGTAGAVSAHGLAAGMHSREFWRNLAQPEAGVPEDENLDTLVAELTGYLAAPDPELRDAFGYTILARWIHREGRLDGDRLAALATTLLGNLRVAPVSASGDAVFQRSFSALVLSIVIARDVRQPTLPPRLVTTIVDAACRYANEETDFRGWVDGKGWAHAAAHTADLLRWLARHPNVRARDQQRLLAAVAALVTRTHGTIFAYGEDGRLAAAVVAVVQRDDLDQAAWKAWAESLRAPLGENPQPSLDSLDEPVFAAQRNARNLIYSTYVQLDLIPDLPTSATTVRQTLGAILLGK